MMRVLWCWTAVLFVGFFGTVVHAQSDRDIQTALTNLGYNVGTVDGVAGQRTAIGIEGFFRAYGYPISNLRNGAGIADIVDLGEIIASERSVYIQTTDPRIEGPTPADAFAGAPSVFPEMTYANGYHFAKSRHRQFYVGANPFNSQYFEWNTGIEEWQWEWADHLAAASGDPYAQALVLIEKTSSPTPDFETEFLPALSVAVEEAHANAGEHAYAYRAFASFNWQFQNGNPCGDDTLAQATLPILDRTLELFTGDLASDPSQGRILIFAADCARGAVADAYLQRRVGLASQIDPKASAVAARDLALQAMEAGDPDAARASFLRMHDIIKGWTENGYSEQMQPGMVATADTIYQMHELGMTDAVAEATAALVEDFTAFPVQDIYNATVPGDLLREVIGDIAAMLVYTRQDASLKSFGNFISEGRDEWAAVTFGVQDLLTSGGNQEAADAAAYYKQTVVTDGVFGVATLLALQEAEARIRLGSAAQAETALVDAQTWLSGVEDSTEFENKIQQMRSELGLSDELSLRVGQIWAPVLNDYYSRACESDVLGSAGVLEVEVDHIAMKRDPRIALDLLAADVDDTFVRCAEREHVSINGPARLLCHLSAVSDQYDVIDQLLEFGLRDAGFGPNVSLITNCAMGLGDAERLDLFYPYFSRVARYDELQLLSLSAIPPDQRDDNLIQRLAGLGPVDEWTPDLRQFLGPMSQSERRAAHDQYRTDYQIMNSGASMRAYELEFINQQAVADAYGWLSLGLPEIAETMLYVDERITPEDLKITDDAFAIDILSDNVKLRLVEGHARVALAHGDHQAAHDILDPLTDSVLRELTATTRLFPATIEQFSERGAVLMKLWLENVTPGPQNAQKVFMVQQALGLAGSTASLSALDERLNGSDPALVRDYQDALRSLRILQSRPTSERDPEILLRLSEDVLGFQDQLSEDFSQGGGAFGVISGLSGTVAALGEMDAGLLVATFQDKALLLSWVDGNGFQSTRVSVTQADLAERIAQFRTSITSSTVTENFFDTAAARDLHDLLFGWVQNADTENVNLVLDGPLAALPFAALQTAEGQWLGATVKLVSAPSVAWAIDGGNLQTQNDPSAFIGFGAPDYAAASTLAPLPETEAEVRFMALSLGADPENDVFIGPQASEDRLGALNADGRLGTAAIVSFATHGLLSTQGQPAALALSASGISDGLLTSNEIFGLRLNADLVILSACNTGTPDAGAGLSDLASAFFYAGAKSLLVSHWEVDSGATIEFMKNFALISRSSGPPASSVRETIQVMSRGESAYSHPRYWAAFFIIG